MTKLLEVKGLHSFYDESHILHGVSFDIEAGQAVSLMGRNGMGKTTTLKSTLGRVQPRSGHVFFQGEDIWALSTWQRVRKDIAYVPGSRGMLHNLSVKEHPEMSARSNNQ